MSDLKERKFGFKPIDGEFINFSLYAPGFQSDIAGRWGRHIIPGQSGDLKEDLGEGSLTTEVRLQFAGRYLDDPQFGYVAVMSALSKSRRGSFMHPRRQTRNSVITRMRESVTYTDAGDATIVDLTIEDAIIGTPDAFRTGPSAFAQQVTAQSLQARAATAALKAKVYARTGIAARQAVLVAEQQVTACTDSFTRYAAAAQESFSLSFYDPAVQAELRALPPQVQAASDALRAVGPAADVQESVLALEVGLSACNQLDAAIRAAQPVPIESVVTRRPGQSIYQLVQQHYGRTGKTPSQMRDLGTLILRLNPHIRRPSLILAGTAYVRPAA